MRSGYLVDEPDSIPRAEWDFVYNRVKKLWVPKEAPHHSILGLTGSGKSHLIRHGLLPMCKFDHVLIMDCKGDDPTLKGLGKPVRKLPDNDWDWRTALKRILQGKGQEPEPEQHWYRLMIPDRPQDYSRAVMLVEDTLNKVYAEGNWVVVVDEAKHLTDKRPPFLNQGPLLEHLWTKGRARGIPVIAASQEPRWLPGSFYSQASFIWMGRLRDERMQVRLTEVGGMTRKLLPQVSQVAPREWIMGITGAQSEFYLTTVTKPVKGRGKGRDHGRMGDRQGKEDDHATRPGHR